MAAAGHYFSDASVAVELVVGIGFAVAARLVLDTSVGSQSVVLEY